MVKDEPARLQGATFVDWARRRVVSFLHLLGASCITCALTAAIVRYQSQNGGIKDLFAWLSTGRDGLRAYQVELWVLGAGIAQIVALPLLRLLSRYRRSWWAGTVSAAYVSGGIVGIVLVAFEGTLWTAIVGMLAVAFCLVSEWRRVREPVQMLPPIDKLRKKMARSQPGGTADWKASCEDAPIERWEDDLLGRQSVVEMLCEYAFAKRRLAVIAVHGGLGDGKSSVLNLLRRTVRDDAVIVSFNAWLPGSEATLAQDLINAILAECRRVVIIPRPSRRVHAFARIVSGSFDRMKWFADVVPPAPQSEEIRELSRAFRRVPKRILVLLDELERMQRRELVTLTKFLRGAPEVENVTFLVALEKDLVQARLEITSEEFEKFFPLVVSLGTPSQRIIWNCARGELLRIFRGADTSQIGKELDDVWTESLSQMCTNLRRANLLVNDVRASTMLLGLDVHPVDLTLIRALRRFSPKVHELVQRYGALLTNVERGPLLGNEDQARVAFQEIRELAMAQSRPAATLELVSRMFPEFAAFCGDRFAGARSKRDLTAERRIASQQCFALYFRSDLPEEMFSVAEFQDLIGGLKASNSDENAARAFRTALVSASRNPERRTGFLEMLWDNLDRDRDELGNSDAAVRLAYIIAEQASDFSFDWWTNTDGVQAAECVLVLARRFSSSPRIQQVLEESIWRASHDGLTVYILDRSSASRQVRTIQDLSNIDEGRLRTVFVERMRNRYRPGQPIDIGCSDWTAFLRWVESSAEDQEQEQAFWREFISAGPVELADAINFLVPSWRWDGDPRPTIERLFPLAEFGERIRELLGEQELTEPQRLAIGRLRRLLE